MAIFDILAYPFHVPAAADDKGTSSVHNVQPHCHVDIYQQVLLEVVGRHLSCDSLIGAEACCST